MHVLRIGECTWKPAPTEDRVSYGTPDFRSAPGVVTVSPAPVASQELSCGTRRITHCHHGPPMCCMFRRFKLWLTKYFRLCLFNLWNRRISPRCFHGGPPCT